MTTTAEIKMRKIVTTYPKISVAEDRKIVLLKPKQKLDNEMLAPDETEVQRFVKRIVDRPALINNRITFLPINQLLAKI